MGFFSEFKDFAMRGNVVDMAVGIIIGAAFGGITKSFVDDIMMPPLGYLMGGADFSDMVWTIKEAGEHPVTGNMMEAVEIRYGSLLNVLINFIIVAFAVFLLIKAMNSMKKKEEAAPAAPPKQEVLLEEIRDLLAKKS